MDSLLTDPELLKTGGWVAAAFMFMVWLRSEQSHRRQQQQQSRNLKAFEEFARAAIRSAENPYGKRRELDQKLAEALEHVRAHGEEQPDHALAKALAHVERTGEP